MLTIRGPLRKSSLWNDYENRPHCLRVYEVRIIQSRNLPCVKTPRKGWNKNDKKRRLALYACTALLLRMGLITFTTFRLAGVTLSTTSFLSTRSPDLALFCATLPPYPSTPFCHSIPSITLTFIRVPQRAQKNQSNDPVLFIRSVTQVVRYSKVATI